MATFRYCVTLQSDGWAGIVYVDVTLTRYKVKVKVTGLLNFRKLPKIALLYVYLLRHFGVELKSQN